MALVKINSNLQLHKWQSDVFSNIYTAGKGYTHVVKSKRQCGKSVLLEYILIKAAIEKKGSTSILLSPTLEQARKLFNELKKVVQPTQLYKRHNDVQLNLTLTNGSMILFRSAEQKDALRGYTVTGIYCIDEASFIPDDIFYETLAWVNVSNAPVVIVSTPKFKTGFFYKYYMLGQESGNKIFSYNWSEYDTSALLSNEKLEQYRKEVPRQQFITESLGEFLDNEGGVFGEFNDVLGNTEFDEKKNHYMGIDWGTGQGQDETAVAIFNSDRKMVGLHHFSDKDETATINEIMRLIEYYKPLKVQVESNSIGTIFYGLLDKAIKAKRLHVMLMKFTTTNESKERIINNMQVAIQNKTVTLLNDGTLATEMSMYEMKASQTGKKTYNAAQGYHDDCVIATLLAYDCINKGNYNIRII